MFWKLKNRCSAVKYGDFKNAEKENCPSEDNYFFKSKATFSSSKYQSSPNLLINASLTNL